MLQMEGERERERRMVVGRELGKAMNSQVILTQPSSILCPSFSESEVL